MQLRTSILALALAFISVNTIAAEGYHHFPGIFLGYTNDTDSETNFTLGIEYEYKFDSTWGAGFVYEKTNDAHHGDGITVSLLSLYYHPIQHVRLGIGAGKERIGGDHPHSENLFRLSAAYEYPLGSVEIAPTIAVDFIDGHEAYVVGIAIIKPF